MKKSSKCLKSSIKKLELGNLSIQYEVEKRNVIYPRLEFKKDKILVILPKHYRDEKEILDKKSNWLLKKQRIINDALKKVKYAQGHQFMILGKPVQRKDDFSETRLREILRGKLEDIIKVYSKELGVKINKLFIRKQKTKWASCSEKRNLSFNLKLVHLPENVINYVVYHEMVHIKERKHNRNFWRYVERKFPDYKEMENLLLGFWFHLDNY
ncbi:DUF45 domain-containing protein [Candidatus Bathyarchaeota archaeon]|nr:DUF45 domain-containing protein [Candidatus Bathyarchaeota archaeon]